jgi:hypothetical protein
MLESKVSSGFWEGGHNVLGICKCLSIILDARNVIPQPRGAGSRSVLRKPSKGISGDTSEWCGVLGA